MNRKVISIVLLLALTVGIMSPAGNAHSADSAQQLRQTGSPAPHRHTPAAEAAGNVFIENRGQVGNGEIRFYAASGGIAFGQGAVFLYCSEGPTAESRNGSDPGNPHLPRPGTGRVKTLRATFPGANPAVPEGTDPAPWGSNFLLGSDPDQWRTGVSSFQGVIYRNLWEGIDLAYTYRGGGLKYEFRLQPGADHGLIRVRLEGQEGISAPGGNTLSVDMGGGMSITDSGLDVYYADDSADKLDASFEITGQGTYTFDMAGRDMGRAVVIDPLIYSTYLGGSGFDMSSAVAVGPDGCAYLIGYTDSPNFPTTPGALVGDYFGWAYDVFVAKVGLNGQTLVYATYLGDTAGDYGQAIAVDATGSAYIAGYTMSWNYPTSPNAFQAEHSGDTYDAFVTKLSPAGDSIVYSSFLGGYGFDFAYGITVDANGFAYVAGDTRSFDFPVTPTAVMSELHAQIYSDERDNIIQPDAFVAKVSQTGDALQYCTYLGYDGADTANAIAVDGAGYAYVTGLTYSDTFPMSADPFDETYNGLSDVFVTGLSQTGSRIMYSTFLGSGGIDIGTGIAVGPYGHIYVAGYTTSAGFPTTADAHDRTHNGLYDPFVTMIQSTGRTLVYSTFLGGTGSDFCTGMVLDRMGNVYITGRTDSADFPVTDTASDTTQNGGFDAFIGKISQSGSLVHSTFLGGAANDYATGVGLGSDGFVHITGGTESASFPVTQYAVGQTNSGNTDAFVCKLDAQPPEADAGPDQAVREGTVVRFDGTGSEDNHGIVNYTWAIEGEPAALYGISPQRLFPVPGLYRVTLNVTDLSGNWAADSLNLTVLDVTNPVAAAGPDIFTDEDAAVLFDGTASSDNVGIVNYTWTFSEGAAVRRLYGPAPSYIFRTPGAYSVGLEVSDAAGNRASDDLTVTVSDITAPIARAGKDRSVYSGGNFTFNGTASTDNVAIVDFTWRLFDGTEDIVLGGMTPAHRFTVPGIYPTTLTVTDGAGLTGTDVMVLTVLETVRPVAVAGNDIAVDELQPVTFDGSACTDNIGVARWEWSFWDGTNNVTVFGVAASWVFTVPGYYQITLNASDAAGNWDTDTLAVTVSDCLPPEADAGPDHVVVPGTTVCFNGTRSSDSSGIAAYAWTFSHNGTALNLSGALQSFQFWSPGTYNIILTVWDGAGRVSSSQATVTVFTQNTGATTAQSDTGGIAMMCLAACLFAASATIIYRRRRGGGEP